MIYVGLSLIVYSRRDFHINPEQIFHLLETYVLYTFRTSCLITSLSAGIHAPRSVYEECYLVLGAKWIRQRSVTGSRKMGLSKR